MLVCVFEESRGVGGGWGRGCDMCPDRETTLISDDFLGRQAVSTGRRSAPLA